MQTGEDTTAGPGPHLKQHAISQSRDSQGRFNLSFLVYFGVYGAAMTSNLGCQPWDFQWSTLLAMQQRRTIHLSSLQLYHRL